VPTLPIINTDSSNQPPFSEKLPPLPGGGGGGVPRLEDVAGCCESAVGGVPAIPRSKSEQDRFSQYFDCLIHPAAYGCGEGQKIPLPPGTGGGGDTSVESNDACARCGLKDVPACLECAFTFLVEVLNVILVNVGILLLLLLGIYIFANAS
jgi:hypothetical protein